MADIGVHEVDIVNPATNAGTTKGTQVGHVVGKSSDTIQYWIENVKIGMPTKHIPSPSSSSSGGKVARLYPRECRELGIHYTSPLTADVHIQIVRRDGYGNESTPSSSSSNRIFKLSQCNFGMLPIMVMSTSCHLSNKSPSQLVNQYKEESTEFGGYFIISGIERCVRLLQVPRSNFATCIRRSNYCNRGRLYTDMGVAVRCQRYNGDMTTVTNTLHYLTTGGATLKFVARKQEFLLPVVLVMRALSGSGTKSSSETTGTTTVQATFAAKAKQSHWAVMFSTCSYVGG